MTKKDWRDLMIITTIAVVLMAAFTVYDILMVDNIMPISNVLWTRGECAWSIAASWGIFSLLWPATMLSMADEDTIEKMTK